MHRSQSAYLKYDLNLQSTGLQTEGNHLFFPIFSADYLNVNKFFDKNSYSSIFSTKNDPFRNQIKRMQLFFVVTPFSSINALPATRKRRVKTVGQANSMQSTELKPVE